ncbi:cytochrome P450 3A18-like [Mizuhopecten yessoensis]|uniref:cytochrome P450 3A18-like n=1 Tax=Mizuhopecten yessoensis TaxID=6573 RepID=UPI000B45A40C|nr:cytochrome P450 3A18-like [Mizuhopecten yessoensis]XP_021368003.1 cytochrome P450 3A18-like [Mizuhopecten yessoensis]
MLVLGLVDIPIWAQLLILLVGMLIAYVVYMSWDYNMFKKMGVDGPKPSFVVGNMGMFMSEGIVKAEQNLYTKYGKIFGTFEGRLPNLFIADPKLLKEILVKDFNSFVNRRDFDQMDGPLRDSLLSIQDDHWRFVRNMITPTFSGKKLKEMGPLLRQAGDLLIEMLEAKAAKNEDTSLKETFGAYTIDCIARTAFGLEINTQRDPDDPFIKHSKAFTESTIMVVQIMIILFFPFLAWLPRLFQSMGINLNKNATNFFVSVTETALKERRQNPGNHADFLELMAHSQAANEESSKTEGVTASPGSSRKTLTDAEIRSQALLFFLAGYDTTSNSLMFTFYHLAIHTDVCDRVMQEVDDNLGKENPDYDNIKKLTYMEMVIEETMRIFPAASRIDRIASRDVTIGNVEIPKGMIVNIPVGAIQMDPEYWPDPDKFDPERFTPEAKANRDPYTYLPFGAGPRNCIGVRLAMMEQKMCMAQVLQHFRPVRSERTDCPPKISKLGNTVTDGGLWIKFEKRS